MITDTAKTLEQSAILTHHKITVLLIDDQAMIGEAVRRMLAEEQDIVLHYLKDPAEAIKKATELSPTVILQDLVMPEIDGLTLVKFFRANPKLKDIPLIVLSTKEEPKIKAEAFALGANDYLVKLPDKIELIARIRHHSKGYINLLQRNEAYQALLESQKKLAEELSQAAEYVKSLLPVPFEGTDLKTDWRFIPSMSLGGDAFGYHWLDDDSFAMYVIDVCGHGVGPALLSISVMNVLRSHSLGNTDLKNPSEVLSTLNNSFQMEDHNGLYFTIWYGVYNKSKKEIVFSNGGHPPALLLTGKSRQEAKPVKLAVPGAIIGGFPDVKYQTGRQSLDLFNKLYFFSDGVYEVFSPEGTMLEYDEFVKQLTIKQDSQVSELDIILQFVRNYQAIDVFEDDFSMVEVVFKNS